MAEEEKTANAEDAKESAENAEKEQGSPDENRDQPQAEKTEEPKKEKKPAEEAKKEEKKSAPTGKFKDLIKQIESLSAIELAELVKELEERFGVSAAAPVVVAPGAATAGGAAPEAPEKSAYTIVLSASGDQKINVIKALREINPDLGLKEAKDLADNPPKDIKKDAPKEEAEEAKKKLEGAGAIVELK